MPQELAVIYVTRIVKVTDFKTTFLFGAELSLASGQNRYVQPLGSDQSVDASDWSPREIRVV